jgi:hypothetical protein
LLEQINLAQAGGEAGWLRDVAMELEVEGEF